MTYYTGNITGNIIGEGFPDEINNQINQRQKIYGSGYLNSRTPDQIAYLNANTSWCKLVSSVNVDNLSTVQNNTVKSLVLTGNRLAKKYVLFNGTNENLTSNQRSGLGTTTGIDPGNTAYGLGGTEFGIRPMMGIQSVEVKHKNRGSIRTASIKIKAWNKAQFDIIDILYLRLGFNVLLEWGHSMYYDNSGALQKNPNDSLATPFLEGKGKIDRVKITYEPKMVLTISEESRKGQFSTTINRNVVITSEEDANLTYFDFLTLIQNKRLSSNGNYDAMFAKVVNYHWSFQKDGSYDITLDLVSVGDVVESFKINVLTPNSQITSPPTTSQVPLEQLGDQEIINLFSVQHDIGNFFSRLINDSAEAQQYKNII